MDNYEIVRQNAFNYYSKHSKIRSVCLGDVHLKNEGFMHLVYKDKQQKIQRPREDQIKRFDLLRYVHSVIEKMSHYQEYWEGNELVALKINKRDQKVYRLVKYWGFIVIIKNKIRIKIILKQIGDGHIQFWSVIPAWEIRFYKNIRLTYLHTGNIEED